MENEYKFNTWYKLNTWYYSVKKDSEDWAMLYYFTEYIPSESGNFYMGTAIYYYNDGQKVSLDIDEDTTIAEEPRFYEDLKECDNPEVICRQFITAAYNKIFNND